MTKQYAIAFRHLDQTLRLFLRVCRAPSGIYVIFAAGQRRHGIRGKPYDAHSTWHTDGRRHEKSYDRAWRRRQGQRLDAFCGSESFVVTSVDQAASTKLPICDPSQFESVLELPVSLVGEEPGRRLLHVDLVAAGSTPPDVPFVHRVVARWFLSNGTPTIVILLYDLGNAPVMKNASNEGPNSRVVRTGGSRASVRISVAATSSTGRPSNWIWNSGVFKQGRASTDANRDG